MTTLYPRLLHLLLSDYSRVLFLWRLLMACIDCCFLLFIISVVGPPYIRAQEWVTNASSKGIACSMACNQRTKLYKVPYLTQFPTWNHQIPKNCLLISGHIITFHVQWKQNLILRPICCWLPWGFVCLQMPLLLLSEGNKVFLLWIKGLRHTSYNTTFQPVFWMLAKQNRIIAFQVANHFRKRVWVSALYHLWKKKNIYIRSLKTQTMSWVGCFSFLPTLSLQ